MMVLGTPRIEWMACLGEPGQTGTTRIAVCGSRVYAVTMPLHSSGCYDRFFVFTFDCEGKLQQCLQVQVHTAAIGDLNHGIRARCDSNGNLYVLVGAGNSCVLFKFEQSGELIFSKLVPVECHRACMTAAPGGGFYVCGGTTLNENEGLILYAVEPDGRVSNGWFFSAPDSGNAVYPHEIAVTPKGYLAIALGPYVEKLLPGEPIAEPLRVLRDVEGTTATQVELGSKLVRSALQPVKISSRTLDTELKPGLCVTDPGVLILKRK
jgi:hypothetical protein